MAVVLPSISVKEAGDLLKRAWLGPSYAADTTIRAPAHACVKYVRNPWDPQVDCIVGLVSADKGVDNVQFVIVAIESHEIVVKTSLSTISSYEVREGIYIYIYVGGGVGVCVCVFVCVCVCVCVCVDSFLQ